MLKSLWNRINPFRPSYKVGIPVGGVIMFAGDISGFPLIINKVKWQLCDGNNGTPDLRGQFIRGWSDESGQEYESSQPRINNYQGEEIKSHNHSISRDYRWNVGFNTQFASDHGISNEVGAFTDNTGGVETRPKNYSLAFIMRVSLTN